MSRGLLRVTPAAWDAWAVAGPEEGATRPATDQELLQRGVRVLDRDDDEVRALVLASNAVDLPAQPLPLSPVPRKAWKQVLDALEPEARARVFRAEVARNRDGTSLAAELAASDRRQGPREGDVRPRMERRRRERRSEARMLEPVLERLANPEHPAIRRVVRVVEIGEGDVVLSGWLPPFHVQGEPT